MISNKKLQVFVSSTYRDLKPERQAAVEAILKAGHIPAGMELFSAGSESQLETIRRWIDDSDVYMLILGGRYGSVDPKTSLSYTELEYDYALSKDKPIFAVVVTEAALDAKVKAEGKDAIETDYPKELKFFREKVLSRISSFFSDPKDIKLAVHETMADYAKRLDFTGWVSGKEIVDTKPLLEELSRLREEKEKLQTQLAEARQTAAKPAPRPATKWSDEDLREVAKILLGIEVSTKVFTEDKTQPAVSYPILNLLLALGDKLVTGVANKYDATERDIFLYYNVCPKLEIHELAALEKVAGVQWQRYRLTAKGKALLAFVDKNKVKDSAVSTSSEKPSETGQAESAPAPAAVSIPKSPPRKRRVAKSSGVA
ncbi:DUF4062 domain-containing protein [Chitinibacteraceae bacterium HSL-7]